MLILASSSPRRKDLLEMLGTPFTIITPEVDETLASDDLKEAIEDLSFRKAASIFKDHKEDIVLGADTLVTIDGKRLGKPKDKEDAKDMLRQLSGKTHEVITAVSIVRPKRSETFSSVSLVTFYPMSEEEIENYIATAEPLDKAGAYAIQGIGARYIRGIVGDYYAITGLPIGEVYHRIMADSL